MRIYETIKRIIHDKQKTVLLSEDLYKKQIKHEAKDDFPIKKQVIQDIKTEQLRDLIKKRRGMQ